MSIYYNDKLFTKLAAPGIKNKSIMLEANVCRLEDDSLFMSWTGGGDREPLEENMTFFSKSYDNGRTWEESTVLFSHPRKGMFTPELFNYNSKIFAFPCSYYNGSSFCQDCHSYISYSTDCGKTFSWPASIGNAINNIHVKGWLAVDDRIILSCSWIECTEESWACFDGANKKCIVAGKELLPKNYKGLYHQEYCGTLISDDGGENWRICGKIGSKGVGLVEPAIVQLSDGTIVMLIRNANDFRLYESRSYDLGETWSEAVPTDIPSAITKVSLAKDKNGVIYLLNNFTEDCSRNPLSLWISTDDMKTWSKKIDLVWSDGGEMLAYPDAFIDEERKMLCFGWDDRKNIYYSEYPIE